MVISEYNPEEHPPPPKKLTVFLENVELNPGERFLSVDIQGPPGKKLKYIYRERRKREKENTIQKSTPLPPKN